MSSKPRINPWNYPINTGWQFPDLSGALIRASNFESLVAAVTTYRVKNEIPSGNPAEEIEDYICRHNPSVCGGYHAGATPRKAPGDAVMQWIAGIAPHAPQFHDVRSKTVASRMAACMSCPMNAQTYAPTCAGCKKTEAAFSKAFGVPDRRMRHCAHYRWDNALAVRMAEVGQDDGAPENCWRRQILPRSDIEPDGD